MILIPISIEKCNSSAGSVPSLSHLNFCISNKSTLHFDSYFEIVIKEPTL
jgi:hypothetical protein